MGPLSGSFPSNLMHFKAFQSSKLLKFYLLSKWASHFRGFDTLKLQKTKYRLCRGYFLTPISFSAQERKSLRIFAFFPDFSNFKSSKSMVHKTLANYYAGKCFGDAVYRGFNWFVSILKGNSEISPANRIGVLEDSMKTFWYSFFWVFRKEGTS